MKKIKAKRPSRGVGLMQYAWLLGAHAIAGCIYGRTTARKREAGRKEGRETKGKEGMEEGKGRVGDGIREDGRKKEGREEGRPEGKEGSKEAREERPSGQRWDEKCKLWTAHTQQFQHK